jgi:hypothetical protein
MAGRSTTGNISFGIALVAGRKQIPNPAAGMTALVMHFPVVIGEPSKGMRQHANFTQTNKGQFSHQQQSRLDLH